MILERVEKEIERETQLMQTMDTNSEEYQKKLNSIIKLSGVANRMSKSKEVKKSLDEEKFENYQGIRFWGWGSDELDQVPFVRVNSVDMPAGSYKVYIGSKDVKESRFQPFRCGENTGKVYYTVTKSSDGTYTIDSDAKQYTTTIKSITTSRPTSQNIYTLDGRNMGTNPSALPKGIYIIGGRKVIR